MSPDYDDKDYDNDPFAPKKVMDLGAGYCGMCFSFPSFCCVGLWLCRKCLEWEKLDNLNDVIVLQAITKAEEASGVTTGMILSLHERYYRCEIYYTLLRLR